MQLMAMKHPTARTATTDLPAAACVNAWMHMPSCHHKYSVLSVLISGLYISVPNEAIMKAETPAVEYMVIV